MREYSRWSADVHTGYPIVEREAVQSVFRRDFLLPEGQRQREGYPGSVSARDDLSKRSDSLRKNSEPGGYTSGKSGFLPEREGKGKIQCSE